MVIEQVKYKATLIFIYISWRKEYLHNFKVSLENVILMRSEDMKVKCIKECVKKFFFRKLAGWDLTTLLQINFFTDNFRWFWLNEHLRMATSPSHTKYLKSTGKIVIVYAGWNPASWTWNKQILHFKSTFFA